MNINTKVPMIDYAAEQTAYLIAMIENQRPGVKVHIEADAEAEIITAWIDTLRYVFEIGSDDDEYVFIHGNDVIVVPLED